MSKVTRVEVPSADAAAGDLDGSTEDFSKAVDAIRKAAADLDGCWGDDEFGKKFAESYLPYAAGILDNSVESATTLRDIETNLREIVRLFQELDTEGSQVLELKDS